jgi:hypothetical protein
MIRIQTHDIYHLLHFHSNNGYANAPQCYLYTCIACLVKFCQISFVIFLPFDSDFRFVLHSRIYVVYVV